jgi:CLIP-associating protein 1/2
LRHANPAFPLKPFVPPLVHCLQDTDGTVRDCARRSIIEIFKATSVTDAARADLKREMERQSVKKGVAEDVLGAVIGSVHAMDHPDAAARVAPPSRIPTTTSISTQSNPERPHSRAADAVTPAAIESEVQPVFVSTH